MDKIQLLLKAQRIAIVGAPGSGKSTLARLLGEMTGLPVFHMDHIHWKPGWIERDRNERVEIALGILAQERWILEGGLSKINTERQARADLLIWLDLPVGLRFWRVIKRTITYFGQVRPDLQSDCREGLNLNTFRFWSYIWRTRNSARHVLEASLQNAPEHLAVIHLSSTREVRDFIAHAKKQAGPIRTGV